MCVSTHRRERKLCTFHTKMGEQDPLMKLLEAIFKVAHDKPTDKATTVSVANTEGETRMTKAEDKKVLEALRKVAGAKFQESDIKLGDTDDDDS